MLFIWLSDLMEHPVFYLASLPIEPHFLLWWPMELFPGVCSALFYHCLWSASSTSHVCLLGSLTGRAAAAAACPAGRPLRGHGWVFHGSRPAVRGWCACAKSRVCPGGPGEHLQLQVQVNSPALGDHCVAEQSRGQLWELWFLSGLESCFLLEVSFENKQVTSCSIQHHPNVGIRRLLNGQCLQNVAFSWKAVCSTYHSGWFTCSNVIFFFYSLSLRGCSELSVPVSHTPEGTRVHGTGKQTPSHLPSQHALQNWDN